MDCALGGNYRGVPEGLVNVASTAEGSITMSVVVPANMRVVVQRSREARAELFAPSIEIMDMLIGAVTIHGAGFAPHAAVQVWVIDVRLGIVRSSTEVFAGEAGVFDVVLDSGCVIDPDNLVDYDAQILALAGSGIVMSAQYTAYCGIFAP
jgi:hypothetical protein